MSRRKRSTLFDRWLDKVHFEPNSGCWIWAGAHKKNGYGHFYNGRGKFILAHRFSYEFHVGDIPDGLVVMHDCDQPWCVNPNHLSVGTQKKNIQDSFRKGRSVRKGQRQPSRPLWGALNAAQLSEMTDVSTETIRNRYSRGWRGADLVLTKLEAYQRRTPSGLGRNVSTANRDENGRFSQ